MIDDVLKSQILSDILHSPEFKDSKRSQELLQYLYDATIADKSPKESTIAVEFFGKDSNFDPKEDPTVRVQMNHLRKKLEHYYFTTGTRHPYNLEIPKGRYAVLFAPVTAAKERTPKSNALLIALSALVVVLAVSLATLLFNRNDNPPVPEVSVTKSPVWSEFFQSPGKPTLVVLGDYFFLYERTHDGTIGNFVRNLNINSPDDFKELVKREPKMAERFVQSDFTFLRPSSSWGLAHVLPILQSLPGGYSLKLASQFAVDDLRANNIIFVGSFKTLYTLHKFLHVFGLEYSLSPNKFEVHGEQGDSARIFSPKEIKGGNYEKDYAVVAKGLGPEGTTILLLLGFADSGVIEASRAVTDRQMLGTIAEKVGNGASQFTLVVETEGYNQAIFKTEIRYFVQRKSLPDTALDKYKTATISK